MKSGILIAFAPLALFLLIGCLLRPAPPNCITPLAQLRIYKTTSCDGAKAAEARAIAALGQVTGWTPELIAKALHNWGVYIGDPLNSVHLNPYDTNCDLRAVFLAVDDWGDTALAHELAHALNNCGDLAHEAWGARGIWGAVESARAVTP